MPRINLLPWREQQRTERKKAFGVGMVAAGLGAAVVAGAVYSTHAARSVRSLRTGWPNQSRCSRCLNKSHRLPSKMSPASATKCVCPSHHAGSVTRSSP